MEHFVHLVMRFVPFWGCSLALAFGQVAVFYHRKRQSAQWYYWVISGAFVLTVLIWLLFRGDKYSDLWVKQWFGHVNTALEGFEVPQ